MKRIIFCALPYLETEEPITAPAVLRMSAKKAGYESCTLDLNQHFRQSIKNYVHRTDLVENFLYHEGLPCAPHVIDFFVEILDQFTNMILSKKPDIIGLSLLTFNSQVFCRWFCVHLRSRCPEIPIVVGGPGIKNFIANSNNEWVEGLRQTGLIDYYIMGDGEYAVEEFLKGNYNYPGINSPTWMQIDNLDDLPFADYTDYDWQLYEKKVIPLVDSRGCVRACEFCDIIEHWTHYRYRSAKNIFQEMLLQIKHHGISEFSMRNSLTNGNMKEFNKLLDMIVEYNESNAAHQISWTGYFIIRNSQQHPETLWYKLKKSNATLLLGIESVIEKVRWSLGKKFTNQDIEWHLQMAQKYQVPIALLIISAYPTETAQDLVYTKQWFLDRYHYAGNSVYDVYVTYASILPGTKLERRADELGIKKGKYPNIWFNQNLSVTGEMKVAHVLELNQIVQPFRKFSWDQAAKTQVFINVDLAQKFSDEIENVKHD